EADDVRGRERLQPEDRERDERILHALLPDHEGDEQGGSDHEDADRPGGRPAPAVALRDAEHEGRKAPGHENSARDVEALTVLVEALREEERAQDERRDPHRDVHEEDPRPGEILDEDAAEQDTEGGTDAADRAPATERDVPLTAFLEGRDEDGE